MRGLRKVRRMVRFKEAATYLAIFDESLARLRNVQHLKARRNCWEGRDGSRRVPSASAERAATAAVSAAAAAAAATRQQQRRRGSSSGGAAAAAGAATAVRPVMYRPRRL